MQYYHDLSEKKMQILPCLLKFRHGKENCIFSMIYIMKAKKEMFKVKVSIAKE